MSYFASLLQDVEFPPALQSVANINAGVTSTIGSASTAGVVGIQWSLWCDQNCTVSIYESKDNVNWRFRCSFKTYAGLLGGNTVQALMQYVQVRVKNEGLAATADLDLVVALCPIVEAVPPELSPEGNLRTAIYEIESEEIGKRALVTPMNALKVVEAVRLVGTALFEPLSASFWSTAVTGTGTVTVTGGQTVLATGVLNGTARLRSVRTARYIGGSSNYFRGVIRRPAAVGANTQRWGAFSATDGCYFECDNVGGLSVVTLKAGAPTAVPTGSFNGNLGVDYIVDAVVHTYEILWTNSTVWFWIDGELLHKVSASAAPWADTLSLPVTIENNNGANVNDNLLNVRTATINRLGPITTQATYQRINTSTTTALKSGPGVLHAILIGTEPTADWTITVYDNVAAAGTIITQIVSRGATTSRSPVTVDLHDVPFNVGLTILTAGGTPGDLTVIFE